MSPPQPPSARRARFPSPETRFAHHERRRLRRAAGVGPVTPEGPPPRQHAFPASAPGPWPPPRLRPPSTCRVDALTRSVAFRGRPLPPGMVFSRCGRVAAATAPSLCAAPRGACSTWPPARQAAAAGAGAASCPVRSAAARIRGQVLAWPPLHILLGTYLARTCRSHGGRKSAFPQAAAPASPPALVTGPRHRPSSSALRVWSRPRGCEAVFHVVSFCAVMTTRDAEHLLASPARMSSSQARSDPGCVSAADRERRSRAGAPRSAAGRPRPASSRRSCCCGGRDRNRSVWCSGFRSH